MRLPSAWEAVPLRRTVRLGEDSVAEAAVGDGSDELLEIHAVGEAQIDLAGVVEGFYLVWGELEVQAGQVVHITRGEAAEYQPLSFQENMHSYVHLTTGFIPVINRSLPI